MATNTIPIIIDKGFSLLKQTTLLGAATALILGFSGKLEASRNGCKNLDIPGLKELNATILNSTYFHKKSEVKALGVCQQTAEVVADVCRVQLVVNTSESSSIHAEAWLPTDWNGRFLTTGNGGLAGCIAYENLGYGASLGFATIATNNGHDGDTGKEFTNPEILADFTNRSIHVAAVVGKKLTEVYYKREAQYSYYFGCSTGGRQGIYSAIHYPDDFDGILAGAPATNLNAGLAWSGMVAHYLGAPHPESSPNFIPTELWKVVHAEVMKQCDTLDGVEDGIVTEPDMCKFRPEELLCGDGDSAAECLTVPQVETLRKIYGPLYGPDGNFLVSGLTPGAELPGIAYRSGKVSPYTKDWMKYVVRNETLDFSKFGLEDVKRILEADPGEVSTYSGDLAAFRARGGRVISYHGQMDDLIASAYSKAHYNLVARKLGLRSSAMDEFYRLFLIPGMQHCVGGPGAFRFGQWANTEPRGSGIALWNRKRAADNILLALVDWVERGNAPEMIVGESEDGKRTRKHCRYPQRSGWNGVTFECIR